MRYPSLLSSIHRPSFGPPPLPAYAQHALCQAWARARGFFHHGTAPSVRVDGKISGNLALWPSCPGC